MTIIDRMRSWQFRGGCLMRQKGAHAEVMPRLHKGSLTLFNCRL